MFVVLKGPRCGKLLLVRGLHALTRDLPGGRRTETGSGKRELTRALTTVDAFAARLTPAR